MTVLRPEILLLLWLVPLIIALFLRAGARRRRILEAWASPQALAAIRPRITPGAATVKMILATLCFVLAVGALAGVQYGSVVRDYERRGVNIMVVLDCSRSMLAEDVSPNRLERAKREVKDLLEILEGDKVGLVAFSGTAFLQCPLTLDYSGLHIFLDALSPDFLPVGGTDLALAIRTATESFRENDGASRAMIIISDGGEEDEEAYKAAREAGEAGILVYALGVGTLQGAPVPDPSGSFMRDRNGEMVNARLQEDLLTQVALATNGTYVRSVPGDEDLRTLYSQHLLSDLAAQTLEQGTTEIREDRFQWFLLGAVALLAAAMAIPMAAPARRGLLGRILPLAMLGLMLATPALAASVDSLLRQGMAAYGNQDFEAARDAFLEASILEPDNAPLLYDLGNTQYRLGNFEEAASSYSQGLARLVPEGFDQEDYTDPDLAEAFLYNLGNTAYRMGDLDRAEQAYEQALAIRPDDEDARLNLEYVRWKKQQQEQQQQEQQQQNQDQNQNQEQQQDQNQQGQDQQQNQDQQQDQQQNQDQNQQDQDQQQDQQQNQQQGGQDQQDQQNQQDQQDQQQNQDQNDQDQDQQQGGQDQQDQQNQQDQQDQQQDQQDQQSPGQDQNQQNGQDDRQQEQAAPQEQAGEELDEQAGDQQEQAMQAVPDERETGDVEVDEAVLNRLEDKPGRALMPRSRSRRVDEDW